MGQKLMVLYGCLRICILNVVLVLFAITGCQAGSKRKIVSVDAFRPVTATAELSSEEEPETVPMRDVLLTAELPMHNAYGAAIPVRVTLTNKGNQQFRFAVATSLPKFVELLQPDGSPCPMTEYGKNNLGNIFASTVTRMNVDRDLSRNWEFDLHRLFECSRPGLYTLKIAQGVFFSGDEPDNDVFITLSNLRFEIAQERD